METQDVTAAIYSEAKSEYTKQLIFNFQPAILRFFMERFAEIKASKPSKNQLSEFQTSLSQIPEWNLDKVQKETAQLLQTIQCDYIEDLITAVFIAHTKILSAIRLHSKPRQKIQITVPKPDHFMHRALSECSRLLWSNVYLFNDAASSLDKQRNMNDVNKFLEEGILQAIRNLLPVKSILRDSLQSEDDTVEHTKSEDVEQKKEEEKPEPKEKDNKEKEKEKEKEEVKEMKEEKEQEKTTLVIDTEKSVGFTGMDSLLGEDGEAELRPMIEEKEPEKAFLISENSETISSDEVEEIDFMNLKTEPIPLSNDDYETL
jgi:hypothetical protein